MHPSSYSTPPAASGDVRILLPSNHYDQKELPFDDGSSDGSNKENSKSYSRSIWVIGLLLVFVVALVIVLVKFVPFDNNHQQQDFKLKQADRLNAFMSCTLANSPDDPPTVILPASPLYPSFSSSLQITPFRHPTPLAILLALSESHISTALHCALTAGITPSVQSGGHSYESYSSLNGSVVINLAGWHRMEVVQGYQHNGEEHDVAIIDGSIRLGPFYRTLYRLGKYDFNGGSCPTVGLPGYVLGGGTTMLIRARGFAADQAVGFRIALFNGSVVEAREGVNEDLFWALRGAGQGNFGVVTRLMLKVFKTPVTTVMRMVLQGDRRLVVRWWMDYFAGRDIDHKLTTQISIGRGNGVNFQGCFLGPKEGLQVILDDSQMEELFNTTSVFVSDELTLEQTKAFFWWSTDPTVLDVGDYLIPAPRGIGKIKSRYGMSPLAQGGVDHVVEFADKAPNSGWISFTQLGGAMGKVPKDATPMSQRDALWHVQYGVGLNEGDGRDAPNYQWIVGVDEGLEKWSSTRRFVNYIDSDIGEGYGEAYWGRENFERLKEVKRRYDPGNVFRYEQSVPLV